ncbi:helix-turn-helix domain-containing protein [Streptomyces sp. NPDC053755]|uniref:telomere-associated protein Tap n=1 Tax=Streptomyces sp. NPDC053755 TaxID=3155815 RepID=UPI00343E35E0
MPTEEELFSAVDALLAGEPQMPSPKERARLREAAGVTQARLAQALETSTQTVKNWESGRSEPRPPRRQAYRRLLEGWAAKYPVPDPAQVPAPGPAPDPALAPAATPAPAPTSSVPSLPSSASTSAPAREPLAEPAARTPTAAPRPGARRAATGRAATAPQPVGAGASSTRAAPGARESRFGHGPLAVIDADDDGRAVAYCVDGLVLDVPAASLPSLVEWALTDAGLGQEKLHGAGKDADPLLVLTEGALRRYGLPEGLTPEERLAGRLPDSHPAVARLHRAAWRLTKRGFGPWARIYRPAQGATRSCVQLCVPSWDALDARHWNGAAQLPPAELARLLGTYATRVMTPRGSTAVTGLELMTAFHPPTRATRPDTAGVRHSEHNPSSLGKEPVDCAPCEAPDGHPLLAHLPRFHERGPDEMLFEEAYDWARPLTDAECTLRHVVGIDVNLAFGAAANGAVVGLAGAPVRVDGPAFDPKVPGSWLVDLSHVDLSRVKAGKEWRTLDGALLPSPFTPTGERPAGPAWYATPTVAYAVELGYEVAPLEAWLRPTSGRYLDDWYKRLRHAYIATMADLGVTESMGPSDLLAAMDGHRRHDPGMAVVLSAIKATVKGGIGKLRERPRGGGWRPGQPWPALARPTWRPDIRATVISRARVGMHRKMVALAAATGRYPVAVLSDCAVYAADGPSPLDVLPYAADGTTVPGSFRIGVSPGMVKHEGTQTTLWAEGVREKYGQDLNLARYVKTGEVTAADDGQ